MNERTTLETFVLIAFWLQFFINAKKSSVRCVLLSKTNPLFLRVFFSFEKKIGVHVLCERRQNQNAIEIFWQQGCWWVPINQLTWTKKKKKQQRQQQQQIRSNGEFILFIFIFFLRKEPNERRRKKTWTILSKFTKRNGTEINRTKFYWFWISFFLFRRMLDRGQIILKQFFSWISSSAMQQQLTIFKQQNNNNNN